MAYLYDKVQRDLRDLDLLTDRDVREALLDIFDRELTPRHYNGGSPEPRKVDEENFEDCDIWQFAWVSQRMANREMSIKFCLHGSHLYLLGFHESTRPKHNQKGIHQ